MKQWLMIQNYVAPKWKRETEITFVVIDRSNRGYVSLDSLGKRPQMSDCAFFVFHAQTRGGLDSKKQNQIPTKIHNTRDTLRQWNHAKIPTHQKISKKSSEDIIILKRC